MDFDRELSDIFTIQSEIATSIAKELKVRLVQSEREQLDKSLTSNVTAYQEYLIGKHNLNQRTSGSIQSALTHFEKARKDPFFALPYTQIAYCYTLIGVAGYGNLPRPLVESKAKAAVIRHWNSIQRWRRRTLHLDISNLELTGIGKVPKQSLQRAIELKPGYSTAHEWYALLLGITVRLDAALEQMKTAYELDPLSPSVSNGLARVYHFRRENKKSLEQVQRTTLELEPGYAEAHFSAGMTYLRLKDYSNSEKELRKAMVIGKKTCNAWHARQNAHRRERKRRQRIAHRIGNSSR